MDIARQIELYLLDRGTWVPTRDICERFSIPERRLRADGARTGLLDEFAVSSTKGGQHGFIHQRFLPTAEWLPIKHRLRRHAIAELRRVGRWDRARQHCRAATPEGGFTERHTGQALMPL